MYNIDRLLSPRADDFNVPQRSAFIADKKTQLYGATLVALAAAAFFSAKLELLTLKLIALALLPLALYYCLVYFIRAMAGRLAKPVLISAVWCLTTVIVPLQSVFDHAALLYFSLARTLIFLSNVLWFEFRDVEGDVASGKPNPLVRFSPFQFALLQSVVLLAALGLVIVTVITTGHSWFFVDLLPLGFYLYLTLALQRATGGPKNNRLRADSMFKNEIVYSGLIDGALILPSAFIFMLTVIAG